MWKDGAFQDQVAVITGGGTGLGFSAAEALGRLGARIVIASRSAAHLEPAVAALAASGVTARAVVTDVRKPGEVARLLERTVAEFGRADILVNNAAGNFLCPTEDLSPGGWKVVIDIALNGVFHTTHTFGRHFLAQGRGRIVNVVATYAWTGGPGTAHSAAAKAGVIALTRSVAVEWASRGVFVNAVCPGVFDTPGARERLWPTEAQRAALLDDIPLHRFAAPGEIANAIVYLSHPEVTYVTGEVLVIDGGMHLGKGLPGHLSSSTGISESPRRDDL